MGKPRKATEIILIAALINLVVNLIVIPKYGINGAAAATSLSYILVFILSTKQLTKLIDFEIPLLNWGKTFFSGLIFVFTLTLIKNNTVFNPWAEMLISISLACLVYLISIYLLKVVDIKELKRYVLLIR